MEWLFLDLFQYNVHKHGFTEQNEEREVNQLLFAVFDVFSNIFWCLDILLYKKIKQDGAELCQANYYVVA